MLDELAQGRHLIDLALAEDLGEAGDVSSDAVFSEQKVHARIMTRQDAVMFGLFLVPEICAKVDPSILVESPVRDGAHVSAGQTVCFLSGPAASILKAERTMLNFLGFLSGISTKTAELVALVSQYGSTALLDTRKTLPGWRLLSKAAVRAGGGTNHRMGLYDMVMLKDNHIDAAGSMEAAVGAVRERYGNAYRIEVECRNLDDVRTALHLGVEVAMLDNMDAEACAAAVELRTREFPGSATAFEASGDMNAEKLQRFAPLGLEYISVGALTHSVKNVNLSLGILQET